MCNPFLPKIDYQDCRNLVQICMKKLGGEIKMKSKLRYLPTIEYLLLWLIANQNSSEVVTSYDLTLYVWPSGQYWYREVIKQWQYAMGNLYDIGRQQIEGQTVVTSNKGQIYIWVKLYHAWSVTGVIHGICYPPPMNQLLLFSSWNIDLEPYGKKTSYIKDNPPGVETLLALLGTNILQWIFHKSM